MIEENTVAKIIQIINQLNVNVHIHDLISNNEQSKNKFNDINKENQSLLRKNLYKDLMSLFLINLYNTIPNTDN